MNATNNHYLLATLASICFANVAKYSKALLKFEYSQTNRIFQEHGLGCGSITQMEYEVTQSALGMLTTSFFLGINGKWENGASRHFATFH